LHSDFNSLAPSHLYDFVGGARTPVYKGDFVERVKQKEDAKGKEEKHEKPRQTAPVPLPLHDHDLVFHCQFFLCCFSVD
jgi:hypothetical protein